MTSKRHVWKKTKKISIFQEKLFNNLIFKNLRKFNKKKINLKFFPTLKMWNGRKIESIKISFDIKIDISWVSWKVLIFLPSFLGFPSWNYQFLWVFYWSVGISFQYFVCVSSFSDLENIVGSGHYLTLPVSL